MSLGAPYPEELQCVARKVVWYDSAEETLGNMGVFLTQLMVYGSEADVAVVEGYVGEEEFRKVLKEAPAGVYGEEEWRKWHERYGMAVPPLPRRRFPDGTLGPEAGRFLGR